MLKRVGYSINCSLKYLRRLKLWRIVTNIFVFASEFNETIAQLDRASVCGTGGRRFESSWSRIEKMERWPSGRRRQTRNLLYGFFCTKGSNPFLSVSYKNKAEPFSISFTTRMSAGNHERVFKSFIDTHFASSWTLR